MVGILVFLWDGLVSGAMLVSGSVYDMMIFACSTRFFFCSRNLTDSVSSAFPIFQPNRGESRNGATVSRHGLSETNRVSGASWRRGFLGLGAVDFPSRSRWGRDVLSLIFLRGAVYRCRIRTTKMAA